MVMAVGTTRGWRTALAGATFGLIVLATLLAAAGPALLELPLALARLSLGTLLVLFGTRWLRKATRRGAGLMPRRDEGAAFRRYRQRLGTLSRLPTRLDAPGLAAAFQATAIEGLEVVFIVAAVGAGGSGLLMPACAGAAVAFGLVCTAGAVLHRPITRIPENALKWLVGAMLSGFGTFWVGEGAGLSWPGGDLSILPLGLSVTRREANNGTPKCAIFVRVSRNAAVRLRVGRAYWLDSEMPAYSMAISIAIPPAPAIIALRAMGACR